MLARIRHFIEQNIDLAGVLDGRLAFTGPEMVQIDLSNKCNNNCIACWCNSPLLGDKRIPQNIREQMLSFEVVSELIEDCANMNVQNIALSGGGEPLTHPHIDHIITLMRQKGIDCHLNTNFTLMDKDRVSHFIQNGLDNIIISLWAATGETYSATHPNKTSQDFEQLLENIKALVSMKEGGPPDIKLYNVIFNENFHEMEQMVQLAMDLGVDRVEFAVADVIPGYTDSLLLNTDQRQELLEVCSGLEQQMNAKEQINGMGVHLKEFHRKIASTGAENGNYDEHVRETVPCHIGWNFSRILADGNVNYCLKAHRIPVGNIYKQRFKEIWNSQIMQQMRQGLSGKAVQSELLSLVGNDPTASLGCHRGCDDIDRNRRLAARLHSLSKTERLMLKGVALYLRHNGVNG